MDGQDLILLGRWQQSWHHAVIGHFCRVQIEPSIPPVARCVQHLSRVPRQGQGGHDDGDRWSSGV